MNQKFTSADIHSNSIEFSAGLVQSSQERLLARLKRSRPEMVVVKSDSLKQKGSSSGFQASNIMSIIENLEREETLKRQMVSQTHAKVKVKELS